MSERGLIYLTIGLGAMIGAVIRYETAQYFSKHVYAGLLAVSVVNVVGSFVIGLAFVMIQTHAGKHLPLFMLTGFLGSLTTFSTFSLETMRLLESAQWKLAVGFVIGQVLFCVLACFAGMLIGRYLHDVLR